MTTAIKAATVLYDGECPLCLKSVAILRRLDWLGRLDLRNARDTQHWPVSPEPLRLERLLEEMHYVPIRGKKVYAGFDAFAQIAWQLPLLWFLAPLMILPGIPRIGRAVYLWIARNRYSLVPCHDGVCVIPPRKT